MPDKSQPPQKPTNWPLFWVSLLLPAFVMVLMPVLVANQVYEDWRISYLVALLMGPVCGWVFAGALSRTLPGRLLLALPFAVAFILIGFVLSFFGCAANLKI